MIDIGFITPSSDYLNDPFRGDPHTQLYLLTHIESEFGNKVNPKLIYLRVIKREFAHRHIPECDIFLHSIYTLDFEEQKDIARQIATHYPRTKQIAGGPHAVTYPQETLNHFDSLIIGEGEESIKQAITDFEKGRLQQIYKQDSKINLNNYPFSRRHFLPKSTTSREGMMTIKDGHKYEDILGTTTLFSRGCPYSCAFCAMPQTKEFDKGTRYNNPDKIKQEIEYLKKNYGIGGINLLDEIGIPPNAKKAIPYLEAIADTNILWRGQTRVDSLTPEITKLAKESGCVALGLGAESVSQQALNTINKKIKVEDTRRTIGLLRENGIESRVYMILGLPGEPSDIVEKTWDFIEDTKPDLVYLSLFTVRPATDVFNNPEKYGIKNIDTNWEKSMHLFGRYKTETPTLTFEYEKNAPWGKAFTQQELIDNYMDIQARLREHDMSHL
ncbi:MAG: radical SAM protein [Nanoarchaeota archaeon]|nr:radical SAM protein [Nanoarchaeota archaeon]